MLGQAAAAPGPLCCRLRLRAMLLLPLGQSCCSRAKTAVREHLLGSGATSCPVSRCCGAQLLLLPGHAAAASGRCPLRRLAMLLPPPGAVASTAEPSCCYRTKAAGSRCCRRRASPIASICRSRSVRLARMRACIDPSVLSEQTGRARARHIQAESTRKLGQMEICNLAPASKSGFACWRT